MGFNRKDLSPKGRRIFAIGNLCLCLGLMLSIFDKDIGQHYAVLYEFSRGLFIGLGATLLICALRMGRSRPNTPSPPNLARINAHESTRIE
jgi:hypothetical protein